MIARYRTPSGENKDHDFGPGPVGSLRGNYERAQNALPLTEAILPAVSGWTSAADLERSRANKAKAR